MLDFINMLSQWASTWLGRAADVLPVGYAFGAGMVASVNPCGFAMLPAYLGLYVGASDQRFGQAPVTRRMLQALLVAAAVSAGFILLFGLAGLLIAAGGSFIVGAFPWVGLLVGLLLIVAGLWLLAGRNLTASFTQRLGARLGAGNPGGVRGFFIFGLAYGTASLSCTLPIFLAVVGSTFAGQGLAVAASQFVSYALGMSLVVAVLTVGLALFKVSLVGVLRRTLPHFHVMSAGLTLLAGVYIVCYWLIEGQLAQVIF